MDLKDFNFEHWWKLVAAAGAAIALASIPMQFADGFLIGIALLCFGAGEWSNHPRRTDIKGRPGVGIYKVSSNPWKPSAFGLVLDAIGIGLFGFSIFRMTIRTVIS